MVSRKAKPPEEVKKEHDQLIAAKVQRRHDLGLHAAGTRVCLGLVKVRANWMVIVKLHEQRNALGDSRRVIGITLKCRGG